MDNYILSIVKTDLQLSGTAYDSLLWSSLQAAKAAITREGVTLTDSEEDNVLCAMYTAYLFRKRRDNQPMPRALRWMLNNRLFSEKGAVVNG